MWRSGGEDDLSEYSRRWRFLRKEAPQIHDDLVLINGYCSIGPGCDTFACLRRSDGHWLWSFNSSSHHISRPAISADGRVYLADGDGGLLALDARSGERHWRVNTGLDDGVPFIPGTSNRHPSITLVDRELLHLDERGRLRAYARDTGALVRERPLLCSVVRIERHGDDVWVSDRDGTITSIDPTTLATRWRARLPGRLKAPLVPLGEYCLALLDRGDLVVRRRDDGRLHCWLGSIRAIAALPREERSVVAATRGGELVVIDLVHGESAPLCPPTMPRVRGEVVAADEHVFAVTAGGVVRIDRSDGAAETVYRCEGRSEVANLEYFEGVLYVFERGFEGTLIAVEGDRVRWRAAISDYFLT